MTSSPFQHDGNRVRDADRSAARAWGRLLAVAAARPALSLFCLALLVRMMAAVALLTVTGGGLFLDDSTYTQLAAEAASGRTQRWGDYEYFLYDATATFLLPLTWLFEFFGPRVFLASLLVALCGAICASTTCLVAALVLPGRYAVGAGLIVALLPSQVLFSSVALKDAFVWALLALLALAVASLNQARGARLILLVGACCILLVLLAHLRLHTTVVASWALLLATAFGAREWRRRRVGVALAVLLVVPALVGAGVAGLTLVREGSTGLDERRAANGVGAATSFVPPVVEAPGPATTSPGADRRAAPGGADQDPGAVTPSDEPEVGGRDAQALARGLSVMLVEPVPGQTDGNPRLLAALVENVVWWPLLLLTLVGTVAWRQRRAAIAFPVLAGGGIVLMYALSEGNFGTAYRHRGEVVWVVAVLAMMGASVLAQRAGRRTGL